MKPVLRWKSRNISHLSALDSEETARGLPAVLCPTNPEQEESHDLLDKRGSRSARPGNQPER